MDNTVDFKIFTNELKQLNKEIINFLKENNLEITYRPPALNFFKDINNLKNLFYIFTMFVYLIIVILLISGKLSLSDVNQIPRP